MADLLLAKSNTEASLGPLVALLQNELQRAGVSPPAREPSTLRQFTLWYLEVIQLLEKICSAQDDQEPMSRTEVELMCRTALSAGTLGEGIELCISFCKMLAPRAGRHHLVTRKSTATFSLDTLRNNHTTASHLADVTGLFAFRQLFQWLVGIEIPLKQVNIGQIERVDIMPLLALFGAPVLQGEPLCKLSFGREYLELPVVRTPREFDLFFSTFPCAIFEDTHGTLQAKVESIVSASLQRGSGTPTQVQIAAALGIPLSTFRHQLKASGASFRELREACQKEAAEAYLGRSDLSIAEVAALLGFSDVGSFRRSVHVWVGKSPSQWRKQCGAANCKP